ncbi:L-threonylcarbamoyladenylate synthase [Enteropsectra breve]|nr:L-threonylcarbamoyladenylate synthase [Enteropsectra breve]
MIVKLNEIDEYYDELDFSRPFVIPTETVYGLAAKIDSDEALRKIFEIKGRPTDNPLIVHISGVEMLETLIEGPVCEEYKVLITKYWPGPLTLIFKCKENLSAVIRGRNQSTVAIRRPRSEALRNLIARIGVPLAAPSANTSGRPSPSCVEHAVNDLGEKVSLYIDDGPCEEGLESTVFGIIDGIPTLLRPGSITKEMIEESLQREIVLKTHASDDEAPICPGHKYKHYAPNASIYLFTGMEWKEKMKTTAEELKDKKIGLIGHQRQNFAVEKFYDIGETLKDKCKNIFSAFRDLDLCCDVIFVHETALEMEGRAFMDRVRKAATYVI